LWQVDRVTIAVGIPQLMMAFTADGQAKAKYHRRAGQAIRIDAAKKMARATSPTRTTARRGRLAKKGVAVQLDLKTVQETAQ